MDRPAHSPQVALEDRDLARLRALVAEPRPLASWSEEQLFALPALYRRACTRIARLELEGENPALLGELRALVSRGHGVLFRQEERREPWLARALELFLVSAPRAIRAEWRLLACSLALFYGLTAVAWIGVARDLDLAYSLMDRDAVQKEMEQLDALKEGEAFRGNFTFGFGESPVTAGAIMLHNITVGTVMFAAALVPPLYLFLLATNALMVGTYSAVAGHWHQAGTISSILWTHGVIELQTLVLVGTAGLVLVRAWVRPGRFTRRHALLVESRRALELFAPTFPLLVIAGTIEGFISPHAPLAVRLAVAGASAVGLVTWVALGGRQREVAARAG